MDIREKKVEARHQKLISDAIKRNFGRKNLFPSMRLGDLREACNRITREYDDCVISFGFVMEDHGEDPVGSGYHNFEMGLMPVKNCIIHPDHAHVVLCDDELSEYITMKSKCIRIDKEEGEGEDKGIDGDEPYKDSYQ